MRDITNLFSIELPIIQAPMAGSSDAELTIAVADAGGLGSLPRAMLTPSEVHSAVKLIRKRTDRPFNLNFFCHTEPVPNPEAENAWRAYLQPYYDEFDIREVPDSKSGDRAPFDEAMCEAVADLKPPVVSFHFGLPPEPLLAKVRGTGAKILSSATTVKEARWLEQAGCDAIIAQGSEAGGHRGMFLTTDPSGQVGTIALVPQIVDAVSVPVIAAGGIADARGIVAAFALGATGVQIGTAYLRCPEATTNAVHRRLLASGREDETVLTNLFTGRAARGFVNRFIREAGPLNPLAPQFPLAAGAVAPLRAKAAATQSPDFIPLWAGQSAPLASELPAGTLTRKLMEDSRRLLKRMQSW